MLTSLHSSRSTLTFRSSVLALLLLAALLVAMTGQRAGAADDPALVGQWGPVQSWPLIGINASLLPNGKVLVWPRNHDAQAKLWNPASNSFRNVPNTTTDLFCSGHSFLPDGRLLVTGGHIEDGVGLAHTNLFDWQTNTWTRVGDMNAGRWYPTNCTLANGDVVVLSGNIDNTVGANRLPQVWNSATGWRSLTNAQLSLPLYPLLHLAPNGKVFMSGPGGTARYLDTSGQGAWTAVADSHGGFRDYGASVMYDSGKVLLVGGHDPPVNTAEVINLTDAAPAWRSVGNMAYARRQLNGLLLPDGKVLVTGGTSGGGFNNAEGSVYAAELWDPATEQFRTLASMAVRRLYHSTTLLLPDGRVLSAGGGQPAGTNGDADHLDAEIFSPPYLFKGPRPTVTAAPDQVTWGQTFTVSTPDAASIQAVNWISLGSVTHANNMHQRINKLAFTAKAGGLDVTAPANAKLCVPGYYMLFLLNDQGVPSIARMVRIDTATETTGYNLSGTITAGGTGLSGATVTTGAVSTMTDADGNYTLTGLAAGTYTITPSKSDYTFTPASRSVSITNADVTGVDFTASTVTVTYSISGKVTLGASGLPGVALRAGSATTTTGASGTYTLAGLRAGTYTVTPSKSGYTFSPASQLVQVLGGDAAGVNFTAEPTATYRISGTITSGGSGLPGVSVAAGNALATTAADGTYTLSGLKAGTYSVTPSRSGYSFSPASRSVTLSVVDAGSVNFAGTVGAASYRISGKVTRSSGGGLSGVKVTAGSKATTTASSGAYTLTGLAPGTYTVTPSREGYGFFPASRSVTLAANASGTNFTAEVVTTLISVTLAKSEVRGKKPVTGAVRFNRKVPAAVTVSLTSSDPAARAPSSVRVKKGKNRATFTVTTQRVKVRTPVTITGKSGSSTKTAQLTVRP